MRIPAVSVVLLSLLPLPTSAQPPGKPPAPVQAVQAVPAGHEDFFRELDSLMKKYPASAQRFALRDRQARSAPLNEEQKRVIQSSVCDTGETCAFWCWSSPAQHSCCACDPLLQ